MDGFGRGFSDDVSSETGIFTAVCVYADSLQWDWSVARRAVYELGVEVSIKWPNDVVVSHKKSAESVDRNGSAGWKDQSGDRCRTECKSERNSGDELKTKRPLCTWKQEKNIRTKKPSDRACYGEFEINYRNLSKPARSFP